MSQQPAQKILFGRPWSNTRENFNCSNEQSCCRGTLDLQETSSKTRARHSNNRVLYSRMEFLPIRPASRLGREHGSAAPAVRTEASPQCRLTIRGHPAHLVRTGGIHENRFVISFGASSRLPIPPFSSHVTPPGPS